MYFSSTNKLDLMMASIGFFREHTGGSITAYVQSHRFGHNYYITDSEGNAPSHLTQIVLLTILKDDGSDRIVLEKYFDNPVQAACYADFHAGKQSVTYEEY